MINIIGYLIYLNKENGLINAIIKKTLMIIDAFITYLWKDELNDLIARLRK